ncbi:MAG: helix-turn-helix domain-containing GNAT family N-acetyltransferase [Planctomycetota bacterium]
MRRAILLHATTIFLYIATSMGSPDDALTAQVRELRENSRGLARALGLMQTRVDGTGCTPAQCHVLIEVSARGPMTATEVADVVQVDKSTASRALQWLANSGHLKSTVDPNDQRAKPMSLTPKGRRCVELIHEMADEQVRSALGHLTPSERSAVLTGVRVYERALRRARQLEGVVLRPIKRSDQVGMARIVRDGLTEFGAIGAGCSIHDEEIDRLQRAYAADGAGYFVAARNGDLLAGAGFARLHGASDQSTCELRKMFAAPEARGLGIGRLLLEHCLDAARNAGYRTCYLETLIRMQQARALYEKLGFRRLDGPVGETGHFACDCWYVLEL